ncbi:MAG TPA: hypothetical protein VH638_03935 [Gemmatimonadaceae bacterium]|jgi:hypothetical protein
MQFWIGLLIGAMIGASVGLLVLAWLHASRRADDVAEREAARAGTPRPSRWRAGDVRVLELPRSVALTSTDANALRAAADALEARGGSAEEVSRLRAIAGSASPPEEVRPVRRG